MTASICTHFLRHHGFESGTAGAEVDRALEPEFAVVRGPGRLGVGQRTRARKPRLAFFGSRRSRPILPQVPCLQNFARP